MHSTNVKGGQLWQAAALRKNNPGWITSEDNPDALYSQEKTPTARQAERLSRRFAMSIHLATCVAGLCYGHQEARI